MPEGAYPDVILICANIARSRAVEQPSERDRLAVIDGLEALVAEPATTLDGAAAKARILKLLPSEELAASLADDVIALAEAI